jgi:tetratricopeptide (TPR) repeat protein
MQSLSSSEITRAQETLAGDPANLNALLLLGRAEMARERYAEARRYFQRAVDAQAASQRARFLLGFCLYVDNEFRDAVPVLREASRLNPKDAMALLYLALSHQGLAEFAEAKRYFEAAMERSRGAEIRLAYARALMENGEAGAAQTLLRKALELEPQSREVHYEMARWHLEYGAAGAAAAAAELAMQLPGSGTPDRQIHFLLARAYGKLGDAAKAAEHRRAFEAIPPRLIR